jgi:hypothetical protein
LANPIKLAKDEQRTLPSSESGKPEGSIGKVHCRSKDSWAGIVSRAEQQVCIEWKFVDVHWIAPEGIRRQLVSEATAQGPSLSLENVGHGA